MHAYMCMCILCVYTDVCVCVCMFYLAKHPREKAVRVGRDLDFREVGNFTGGL